MARRKRYIRGNVYVTNDSILRKTKSKKRRVVATNDDKNHVVVRRILTANKGRNSRKGTRIEKYPDIPKESVVENRSYRKTIDGKNISTSKMRKTKTRLNKFDRKKLGIK